MVSYFCASPNPSREAGTKTDENKTERNITMNEQHIVQIARELTLGQKQVASAADLLFQDCTVPFIARYRKEATGSMDEVAVTAVRDRLQQLADLDQRREAILKSLDERGLLNDELRTKIESAQTMAVLEDIYLPFKPKRRTRAGIAREKGLEQLANLLLEQGDSDPEAEAEKMKPFRVPVILSLSRSVRMSRPAQRSEGFLKKRVRCVQRCRSAKKRRPQSTGTTSNGRNPSKKPLRTEFLPYGAAKPNPS